MAPGRLIVPFRRIVAAALVALAAGRASADPAAAKRDWTEEKCFRYARDWNEALRRFGAEGLSPRFLAGNTEFIRARCRRPDPICPATAKDRKLVDALSIRVVNEGMSTTFLPFDCPHPGAAP